MAQIEPCNPHRTEAQMELLWFLLVIFLVFLVAGAGWRAMRR
jgi:hypothetical protein